MSTFVAYEQSLYNIYMYVYVFKIKTSSNSYVNKRLPLYTVGPSCNNEQRKLKSVQIGPLYASTWFNFRIVFTSLTAIPNFTEIHSLIRVFILICLQNLILLIFSIRLFCNRDHKQFRSARWSM